MKVWFQNRRTKYKRGKADDDDHEDDESSISRPPPAAAAAAVNDSERPQQTTDDDDDDDDTGDEKSSITDAGMSNSFIHFTFTFIYRAAKPSAVKSKIKCKQEKNPMTVK